MVLNVSAQSLPFFSTTAERRKVVEVGMRLLDRQKFIAVIESIFVTRAIDQPEFVTLVALGLLKEPVHDPAKRCDPRASGDERRIVTGLAEREHPVRPVKLDGRTFFQIAKPIRQESLFHAIQA